MTGGRLPEDHAVRERALDPAGSFIVQAPAGSGKTGLLIQRYLALLGAVDHPEEIVAVTFTRKAAGEMQDRILAALGAARAQEHPEDAPAGPYSRRTRELARAALARDAERGWDVAAHPGRLRIQTIDSLCAALTRQMPWLSRFGGDPGIVEDAGELYRAAARDTLAQVNDEVPWAAAIAAVLAHLDGDVQRLEAMLVQMLSRRDQWLRHLGGGLEDGDGRYREHLEAGLARAIGDALAALRAAVPAALASGIVEVAAYAAGNLRERDPDSPVCACAGLATLPGAGAGDLPQWRGIAESLLTKGGAWRTSRTVRDGFPAGKHPVAVRMKERAGALRSALTPHEDLRARLLRTRVLPAARYADAQWEVLRALSRLLRVAAATLRVTFGEGGRADFVEVAQAAVEALGGDEAPTDLALALDYRIRHILVDEFQDTSHTQFELLARLTAGWTPGDGRTLFLVGDPMQSIYRFREADVGLYLRARGEGIGALPLEPLRLSVNFRSRPAVVSWVNEVFPRVFPPVGEAGDATTGAVPWAPSQPFRHEHAGAGVELHPLVQEAARDTRAEEAAAVVDIVREARAADPAASIAVLVRSRSHLAAILPLLRDAGIECRGIDIEPLAARPVVQDLLALTRALLHPADRVAWLALLRAPWCGLRLADLHRLCGDDGASPLPALLREAGRLERLDAGARGRARRVADVMQRAEGSRGRVPLRRAVEGAWCALGGPACVDAADLDDAHAFLDLLEDLAREPLDHARLRDAVAALFAPPHAAPGAVEVMTVHKAKGLEFDTVILPGLGRATGRDEKPLLAWAERATGHGFDLLLAPVAAAGEDNDSTWRYLQALERDKGAHEDGRLLYVAATRARERLHLLAHAARRADGETLRPQSGSLLERMWDAVADRFAEAGGGPPPPGAGADTAGAGAVSPVSIRRLPPGWTAPPPPEPVDWRAGPPRPSPPARRAVEFSWAGQTARHVGTAVHRMLRRMAQDGAAAWDAARIARQRPAWGALLGGLGVPPGELEDAVERVARALENVLADSRGRWLIDAAHRDARSEYALSGVMDGALVDVIVDRTFVDGGGTRWIVDYKTGSHEGADPEAFLDRERERYRPQLERYAALMAQRGEGPIRLGLYFPLLCGWREWGR